MCFFLSPWPNILDHAYDWNSLSTSLSSMCLLYLVVLDQALIDHFILKPICVQWGKSKPFMAFKLNRTLKGMSSVVHVGKMVLLTPTWHSNDSNPWNWALIPFVGSILWPSHLKTNWYPVREVKDSNCTPQDMSRAIYVGIERHCWTQQAELLGPCFWSVASISFLFSHNCLEHLLPCFSNRKFD